MIEYCKKQQKKEALPCFTEISADISEKNTEKGSVRSASTVDSPALTVTEAAAWAAASSAASAARVSISPLLSRSWRRSKGRSGALRPTIFSSRIFRIFYTYADVNTLRERYDAALIDERIKVLAIGTRPDCIDEEIAELIASYKKRVDIWVELGLQSASDETAERINRGYKTEIFDRALKILDRHRIPVVAHVIFGLPGEGDAEIEATVDFLSRRELFGVKIHSIYVMQGTRLADMYRRGEYEPPTLEKYAAWVGCALSRLSPEVVIHRITGDCPRDALVAPEWNSDKHAIIGKIKDYMEENSLFQGKYYEKPSRG